ncbi:MAG: VOC family protein [Burkholderiaceae bacterium]|jgi:catechol 2,3-dioxygenase-like lactoylglutathione lyase family enzyme|nr:VOC family protein [Burkholderiaceae bacterium]
MPACLDHTIVHAHDRHASASFLAEMLGLAPPQPAGRFAAVALGNGVTLDYIDAEEPFDRTHYAFAVSDDEFDAIFARVRERGLTWWADPAHQRPNETYLHGDSRGFYFDDPDGHRLEVLTRSD